MNTVSSHLLLQNYLEKIKKKLKSITIQETYARIQNNRAIVIDVREKEEWFRGHIPGALSIERAKIEWEIENVIQQTDFPLICYCGDGQLSMLATYSLGEMGYSQAYWMEKGWKGWKELKYPISYSPQLELRDHLEKLGSICYLARLYDKIKAIYAGMLPPTEYIQDDWDKALLELLCIDSSLLEKLIVSSSNEQNFLIELKKILGPSWPTHHTIELYNERCQLRKMQGVQKPQFWFWGKKHKK
ncbi:rhodanese-like domain-containing protein [Methylacidiphilum caldifontis]|uniref:Sulfurtransferase n=1 Tax=Methylacidiphilum caldifontis TaxID=2795386 RepID=A0A4Y8PEN7_9BACT|nr:rhodanese-like domain-containing protein [Methylacidiphilum caldifontis]QSR87974.1 DUF5069 domain-containing protein [Methylacidiphilum caldifontis]TFE68734.1 sulfurtransferase [Methylacidiphilum caldifontis]